MHLTHTIAAMPARMFTPLAVVSGARKTLRMLKWVYLVHWNDCLWPGLSYTPLAVVSRARKTLHTAGIAQIPVVSSKEGAVLSTRKFHRGHHWHQTHMNNCRINEITNKLNSAKCWFWVEYVIQEYYILWITQTKFMCIPIIHLYFNIYSMLLVTDSQSKNVSWFAWIWPNGDRWLVNHCAMPSIGQTWVLASIGAVVEIGVLISTIETTAYGV
jgi:hypothetical protein